MAEIFRSRDCIVHFKGDSMAVAVDQAMVIAGWPGGQGVRWTNSLTDERVVTFSEGQPGGFLLWGSNEPGDDYAAMTRSQTTYRYATYGFGGWLISTVSYERYTLASRVGGGPLVPLTYRANDRLYFSSRGLWTIEDEFTILGHPQAPAFVLGVVAQVPKAANNNYIGVWTLL